MKPGKTLSQLAAEIERQTAAKNDLIVDTRQLEMQRTESGAIMAMPDRRTPIRDLAHGQIGAHLDIPAKYYARMRAEAPHLLTASVNHWLHKDPSRRMVRLLDGEMRAFLSDRYARIDNHEIAEATLPVLSEVPGIQVVSSEITESRMYIKAVATRVQQEVTVGDVVQAGVVISNSEVGKGAITVAPLVYRLVCTNGMIVPDGQYRRNHIGARAAEDEAIYKLLSDETKRADDRAILLKMRDVLKAALDEAQFAATVDRLRDAKEDRLEGDPVKAMEVLAKKSGLSQSEQSGVLRHLIEGHDLSRYGVVQAVTRAAHDPADYDRATELEALGGKVLNLSRNEWREIKMAA